MKGGGQLGVIHYGKLEGTGHSELWEESVEVPQEELSIPEGIQPVVIKEKRILVQSLLGLCQIILANGICCQNCSEILNNTRRSMTSFFASSKNDIGIELLDIRAIRTTYDSIRRMWLKETEAIRSNICARCDKVKLKKTVPRRIARKRLDKSSSKYLTKKDNMSDSIDNLVSSRKDNLQILDSLKVDSS